MDPVTHLHRNQEHAGLIQWSAVITRSDIVRYYMNNYKKCVRMSTRLWIHKRHPIPRPSGRAMGCPLRIFWENGPRYNGIALYVSILYWPTTPRAWYPSMIPNWFHDKESQITVCIPQLIICENVACRLAAITGDIILVPCHVLKSLQLIRRWGTRRWKLRVPHLQISYSDLTLR